MLLSNWLRTFSRGSSKTKGISQSRCCSSRKQRKPSWTAAEQFEERVLLSSVSGIVFEDSSGNGIADSAERRIAGFSVSAWDVGTDGLFGTGDDQFVAATRTDSSGRYLFSLTQSTSYAIRFGGQIGVYEFSTSPLDTRGETGSDVNSAGVSSPFSGGDGVADVDIDAGFRNYGTPGSRSRLLQESIEFQPGKFNYFLDYLGTQEKWLKGNRSPLGAWYFLTPDGDLYNWDATLLGASGEFVAVLGTEAYDNPACRAIQVSRPADTIFPTPN